MQLFTAGDWFGFVSAKRTTPLLEYIKNKKIEKQVGKKKDIFIKWVDYRNTHKLLLKV